jgi:hypothetical protein
MSSGTTVLSVPRTRPNTTNPTIASANAGTDVHACRFTWS